ncbi:MAG: glutamine--fructose-6-phosphate transaminase (isomerizing) [Pseudomonadota bacterium]
MCGIVGVTGHERAERVLIEGLRRLEYRGYDSSGVAVMAEGGAVRRARAPGKLAGLEAVLTPDIVGISGVAHTRWATHGATTEANAHPHKAGRVYLVHNGIIENFKALRARIRKAGRTLSSETDSETVAHLLDMALEGGASPQDALLSVLDQLEGAFALAALIEGEPGLLLGARRGPPLVAARGRGAGFLASDVLALTGEAEEVIYLDDGDAVIITPDALRVFNADKTEVSRPAAPAPVSAVLAEKGNRRHFMEKEIHEQPEVVGHTLSAYLDALTSLPKANSAIDFSDTARLTIVGCGTAAYAGLVSEYWFEKLAGLPTEVDIASEFRYREPAFLKQDAALFISQSGETADTLEALRLCKKAGLDTIALVNTAHSTMAREAGAVAPTLAGPEIGVASTKAFTCQLAGLASLAIMAGLQRGVLSESAATALVDDLMTAPKLMAQALNLEPAIEALAQDLAQAQIVLYLGRNQYFPLALEGALKLKEISYIHAEGYAAGELKHGPIALIEEGVDVIVTAPHDALFDKTRSSIEQVKSRGANVIAITDPAGADALSEDAAELLVMPQAGPLSSIFVASVAIQLLAYHVAVHKGTDVDQPRNLAKSVTVE